MASDWNNWQWIGGYGGGYSFHYKESDMNNVPKWVRDALIKLLNEGYDPEGDAQSNGCVELTGKKYRYRIIPVMVEQGNARIDIRRHKKTGRGYGELGIGTRACGESNASGSGKIGKKSDRLLGLKVE